jgi:hypothetical protein
VADFKRVRFDDRTLTLGDAGEDFERFVLEYFSLTEPDLRLVRMLRRRPDGAVDLYTPDDPASCFVECKFIGRDVSATPQSLWSKVKSRLRHNLLSAARGEGGHALAYRAWLSDGGVQQYRFCTSALATSVADRRAFKVEIETFFVEIARLHPALDRLRGLQAQIWTWDDFIGVAASQPSLFYRWFGGLPAGLHELGHAFGPASSFKRYLKSSELPYFSRGRFLSDPLAESGPEAEWTDRLSAGQPGPVALVSGAGGIGKTRLAVEICNRMAARGWWALQLESFASVEGIKSFLGSFSREAKLVFLVDYADRFRELDRLVDLVETAELEGHHTIRFVITCRSSVKQQVLDELGDLAPLQIDAGAKLVGRREDEYAEWVVRSILGHFEVPHANQVAAVCGKLPVLAVFAGFLFRHRPAQFERQFGDLIGMQDFQAWADHRIMTIENLAIESATATARRLARLSIRLPISSTDAGRFEDESDSNRQLLEVLLADGWIEASAADYAAAHDVLADALLARFLFRLPGVETRRTIELLDEQLLEGRLAHALAVIDRLSAHGSFDRIDGLEVISRLLQSARVAVLECISPILLSRMLRPAQAIGFAAEIANELTERLATDSSSQLRLSWLAEWASRPTNREALPRDVLERFGDVVATLAQQKHRSNIALRRAFRFDSRRHRGALFARMADEPELPQTSYLLRAALYAGVEPEEVRSIVLAWLDKNALLEGASFVLSSWLRAGGDPATVRPYAFRWLADHSKGVTPAFVLAALVEREGRTPSIDHYLRPWMETHGRDENAPILYTALMEKEGVTADLWAAVIDWLDYHIGAAGPIDSAQTDAGRAATSHIVRTALAEGIHPDEIRALVGPWIERNATHEWMTFIYSSWLDAQGDLATVRPFAVQWLGVHGHKPVARFVLAALLKRIDSVEIEPYLDQWLEQHGTSESAADLCATLLDAEGATPEVQRRVQPWFDRHLGDGAEAGTQLDGAWQRAASRLLRVALQKGFDADALRRAAGHFVARCGVQDSMSFFYAAWLDAGGDLAVVRAAALEWLALHGHEQAARFVLGALIAREDRTDQTASFVAVWLGLHGQEEYAVHLLSILVDRHNLTEEIKPFLLGWLILHVAKPAGNHLLQRWLDRGELAEVRTLVLEGLAAWGLEEDASFILQKWLANGGDPKEVGAFVAGWLDRYWRNNERANYVITEWVKANGFFNVVGPFILRILTHGRDQRMCRRFISAWLLARADLAPILPHLRACLSVCRTDPQTRFLFEGWLQCGGDLEEVWPELEAWLKVNGTEDYARHIVGAWLDLKGEWSLVRPYVQRWLERRGVDPEVGLALRRLLRRGAQVLDLEGPINAWIKAHPESPVAASLVTDLLERNRQPERLSNLVKTWLSGGAALRDDCYRYEGLLKAGVSFETLEVPLSHWFAEHGNDKIAAFLLASAIDAGAPHRDYGPIALRWLANYPALGRSNLIVTAWLNAGWPRDQIVSSYCAWLDARPVYREAGSSFGAWLDSGGEPKVLEPYISAWMIVHSASDDAELVRQAWRRNTKSPPPWSTTAGRTER